MPKIYTKTGDKGTSMLYDGSRKSKTDIIFEVLGENDELSARVGMLISYVSDMKESDIFVQHSVTAPDGDVESFGISLVEAMSSGLPIVVTNHNGFPDTIIDGKTGFLVPEHDTSAMAERIAELLDDDELAVRMGQAGSEHARRKFDYRKTIPMLRQALDVTH